MIFRSLCFLLYYFHFSATNFTLWSSIDLPLGTKSRYKKQSSVKGWYLIISIYLLFQCLITTLDVRDNFTYLET